MFQQTRNAPNRSTLDRIARDFQLLELGERGIEGFLDALPRMIREANQGCQVAGAMCLRSPQRRKNRPP
jgi:hypothetical protein